MSHEQKYEFEQHGWKVVLDPHSEPDGVWCVLDQNGDLYEACETRESAIRLCREHGCPITLEDGTRQ